MPFLKKEPAETGTLARKVQEAVYASDPDFGNYSKAKRIEAVKRTLTGWNEIFKLGSKEQQDTAANTLLEQMGEQHSYGPLEAAYDVGVPGIGGAVGTAGGLAGTAAGAGTAAMAGETAKAEFERSRRGIPTQTGEAVTALKEGRVSDALQGAYDVFASNADVGAWEAASQLIGNPVTKGILNVVARGARPVARKFLMPKTGLPEPVAATQKVLGEVGESLTAGQLNAHEKNFVYFLEGIASGSMFGGLLKRKYRANFDKVQGIYKNYINQISTMMEPSEWGNIAKAAYNGELSLVKILRDEFWGSAREELAKLSGRTNLEVDISPLIDWFAVEAGKRGRRDVIKIMSNVNDFLGLKSLAEFKPNTDIAQMTYLIAQELQGAPRKLTATQAADLLQRLNSLHDSSGAVSDHAADLLRDPLVGKLREAARIDPAFSDVADTYLKANDFHRVTATRLQDGLLPQIMKTLKDKPTALTQFVHGGGAPYDNLMALKKTYASERLMEPRVVKKTGEVLEPQAGAGTVGKPPFINFERDIKRPLRYDLMQRAYVTEGVEPHFSGDALMGELERMGMRLDPERGLVPGEYLDELFTDSHTGKKYFPRVLELANALKGAATTGSGDTVFVKFAQAGVGVQAMTGQAAPGFKTRVAALFIGPLGLSKILADPRLLAETTSMLKAGPGTTAWSRGLATIARLQTRAAVEKRGMLKEEQDFYADKPTKRAQLPWTMGLGGFR